MNAWNERWESSPKGRTTYEYFLDVRNRSRMNWIQLNHQVAQLLSGHGNFRAYLRRFAIQEDDTCDCDLQESETVLHLVNDCPHHIKERRPLSVAGARAGVEWPQPWSSGSNVRTSLSFSHLPKVFKARRHKLLRHARNLTHSDFFKKKL